MIDYGIIDRAASYYEDCGYARIETPWLISRAVSDVTKPIGASTYTMTKESKTASKVFVASGEQSFLYLMAKGQLPSYGMFQTITPCLRDDDHDETHVKNFMKLELIEYWQGKVDPEEVKDSLPRHVANARDFFWTEIRRKEFGIAGLQVIKTGEDMYDIQFEDVEVGSYGIRHSGLATWIYATGVAEPRFSRLLAHLERKHDWDTTGKKSNEGS